VRHSLRRAKRWVIRELERTDDRGRALPDRKPDHVFGIPDQAREDARDQGAGSGEIPYRRSNAWNK